MKLFYKQIDLREILFKIGFFILLFLLYSFDRHNPTIELYKVVFFLHYTVLSIVISDFLLPRYFYPKKYFIFITTVLLVFLAAYLLEELFFEPLFFKGERGQHVSNIFYTLLDIIPLVLTMVSFTLAWDALKKQNEVDQLKLTVQESELRFLKSQLNPHFLFNNLNNLYAYAIENSPKTPSIILELSSVLRYMLYDCKEDYVLISKEIEHLKHFTALNELQIEDRGEVTFNSEVVTKEFQIAPLLLMVFIENAFKHSTASQSQDISIHISVTVSNDGQLEFSCSNSYNSEVNNVQLSKGIGLENVKKRLALLYPNRHSLIMKTENDKYDVSLILQLQSNI